MDLFGADTMKPAFAPGAMLLAGFACTVEAPLLAALQAVVTAAPFRHMVTPDGHRSSTTGR